MGTDTNKTTSTSTPRRTRRRVILAVCAVLVVIGVIGYTLALPALRQARIEKHNGYMERRLKFIVSQMHNYAFGHDRQFPPHVGVLLEHENLMPKHYFNPNTTGFPEHIDYNNEQPTGPYVFGDYYWVYDAELGLDVYKSAIIAYSRANPDGDRNVVFADTHAKVVSPYDFHQIIEEQNLWRRRDNQPTIDPDIFNDYVIPKMQ